MLPPISFRVEELNPSLTQKCLQSDSGQLGQLHSKLLGTWPIRTMGTRRK